MPERSRNVWAPWRMAYIEQLGDDDGGDCGGGCFLCDYREDPGSDAVHHVLWRTATTMVLLNRFPYTGGHLLVAPLEHVPEPDELPDEIVCDLARQLRDAKRVLTAAFRADGYNLGMNLGRCAGAGLPGHMHWHIVPRWGGDTNFMSVTGDARVIPISLDAVYERLQAARADLGVG